MRPRKIKEVLVKLANFPCVIIDSKKHCGKFGKLFKNNNPIHLEIGAGKGDFIINMAMQNKDINYIGIEKVASILYKAALKIEKPIDNLLLILGDANLIDEIVNQEISLMYLNFSDPWPKKKHYKRRLTASNFLVKYQKIFINKPRIILKTDNLSFFEFSLEEFKKNYYQIIDYSYDLHNRKDIANIQTEYEKKFAALGKPILWLKAEK